MRKYTASMLSEGNHLFQASITILDNGVKLRIPNFWRDQETFFSFSDISGVELTTPSWYAVLTYSTINFNLRGTWVEAHGFTKSDAITIKKLIDSGRYSGGNSTYNEFGEDTSKFSGYKQQQWINYQHDRQVKLDREERIARKNEQNKELIPKLKKILVRYYVDILSYDLNSLCDKLDDMVPPPNNINAIEELRDYKRKLIQILYDIYEDYWEIEYEAIKDEITKEYKYLTNNCDLKGEIEEADENFDWNLEDSLEDDDPFKFPEFVWPEKSNQFVITEGLVKAIKNYDDLNLDMLEDENQVNENKILVRDFVRQIFKETGRDDIQELFNDIEEDGENNDYSEELAILFSIINEIYSSGILDVMDDDGEQKLLFGLQNVNVIEFLKNKENPLHLRLSKIVDVTDNIIDRIDKIHKNK